MARWDHKVKLPDFEQMEEQAELERIRIVELEEGSDILIKRIDPYGFWQVSLKRGPTPVELAEQQFTNFTEALKAINKYVGRTGKKIKRIDVGARTAIEQQEWERQQLLVEY